MNALIKEAKLTSMKRRQQMKRYREQNKHKLRRQRKIRRQKQKAGVQRKYKRVGNPASGYQFVPRGEEGGGGGGGSSPTNAPSTAMNFDPDQLPSSTEPDERMVGVIGHG